MCAGAVSAAATHHSLTSLLGYVACHAGSAEGIAFRANLLSALLASGAVGLFFAAARRCLQPAPALFATAFLLLSHSMWWHATVAEVYAANALGCAAVLYALARVAGGGERWLLAAAFLAALSAFNHLQMGFWLPGLLLAGWTSGTGLRERSARVLRVCAAYGAGLVPLAAAFVHDVVERHGLRQAAVESAGGEFTSSFFTVNAHETGTTLRLFALQWGWPSLVLLWAAWGAFRIGRSGPPALRAALPPAFLVNTAFFAYYPMWDKFAFLLASFVIVAFVAGHGLDAAWERAGGARWARLGLVATNAAAVAYMPLFFARVPDLAERSRWWSDYARREVSRRTMFAGRYLAWPAKEDYDDIERFVAGLSTGLPPRAILWDHVAATFFQLRHAREHRGWRPDVVVRLFVPRGLDARRWPSGVAADDAVALLLEDAHQGPVYVTSYQLGGFDAVMGPLLDAGYTFVEQPVARDASVFRLVAASVLDAQTVVSGVERRNGDVVVSFARRNPPVLLRARWFDASGRPLSPGRWPIPFDCAPVAVGVPPAAARGEILVFERVVAAVPAR